MASSALSGGELGWWLKEKVGLDALRKQLLETGLAGAEHFNVIEAEMLRLFRDLHLQDPLFGKAVPNIPFAGCLLLLRVLRLLLLAAVLRRLLRAGLPSLRDPRPKELFPGVFLHVTFKWPKRLTRTRALWTSRRSRRHCNGRRQICWRSLAGGGLAQ